MSVRMRRRGSASVEIVVMLPFFILLLLGVYHLHKVGSAALLATERARGCAFQFAVQGCRDADKATGLCAGALARTTDQLEQADQTRAGTAQGEALARPALSDKIEKIPLVGALWAGIFGEGSMADASVDTPLFGKQGTTPLTKSHYMVCNTVAKTWADLRKEQLCGLIGQLGISGKIFGC
jgi:hypothetical protein